MHGSTTVGQLLRTKGSRIWSVRPDDTVYDAIAAMAEHDVGALPVVDDGGLVGILSERDYARKVILKGRASRETRVRDVMTSDVITIAPDRSMQDCMELMTDRRIRHLPVLRDGQLIGIISIGDVVKATIAEQAFLIEQLQSYIQGTV